MIITKFANTSFLADRKAAFIKLLLFFLNFIRIIVHVTFVSNAPNPTKVNLKASGGKGLTICSHAVHNAVRPGKRIITTNILPNFGLKFELIKKEKKIRRLTKVSSRKSIESANNETELIFTAADNSIKKYVKFNNATINKVRLKEIIFEDLLFLLKVYF